MKMTVRRNPHTRLLRALEAMAEGHGRIGAARSEPWASNTFEGARHLVTLAFSGAGAHDRANRMADALPEATFEISGHIVADVSVDGRTLDHDEAGAPRAVLELSALTIEDW
jgi:hypothetical protein